MNIIRGSFVLTKSIDEIQKRIAHILNYGQRIPSNNDEEKAICRTFCEMTKRLLIECYEQGMWAVEHCKRELISRMYSDHIEILREAKKVANTMLWEITLMRSIEMKDFPSCKELLNMEKDLATKCAKDLVQNKIVKAGIHGIILMSKADDLVTISDVWNFYANIIKELEREVREENWQLSPTEQTLLIKAQAECGYCFLAMLKTGYNITDEINEMIDEAKANKYINDFEKLSIPNNASFMTMQHP